MDSNSGLLQHAQPKIPGRFSSFKQLDQGLSVPASLVTWNVCPSRTSLHSALVISPGLSLIFCSNSSVVLPLLELDENERAPEDKPIKLSNDFISELFIMDFFVAVTEDDDNDLNVEIFVPLRNMTNLESDCGTRNELISDE